MEKYLEIGKIVNTHGFRGDVKIQTWCDSPETAAALKTVYKKTKDGFAPMKIIHSSVHKGMLLAKIEGIDDFDAANLLRETVLYAERDDIPKDKDAFFISDLIGLDVFDADTGKKYGVLKEILQYGAHDIYTVSTEKGEVMIPGVSEFIKKISVSDGIYVKAIGGMFDEV